MSFSNFNLQQDFLSSIEGAGYKIPTPLQEKLIPIVEAKKSALIWTQSAPGKTGAFLIPTINYILENPAPEKRGARVLILTSRRDRVSQINYTVKNLSKEHTVRFGFIVSGRPYQTQMRLMRRPLDIMIATPGRLNDLMNNGKADFSQLEMLIIDDLTSIFQKNLHGLVENILNQAGSSCRTITFLRSGDELTPYAKSLFPAAEDIFIADSTEALNNNEPNHNKVEHNSKNTLPNRSQQEPAKKIKNPNIDFEKLMLQKVHIADDYTHKIAMMDHLLDEFAGEPSIIYTATNKAAKTLQDNLANHGHAAELIQDLSPDERKDCDILIHSDQEKIDTPKEETSLRSKHVIHFDLPYRTDRYLKRLEAHAQNEENVCLLIIDGHNYNELKHIEKTLGKKIEQITVPGLEPLKPFVNLSKPKKQLTQQRNNKQRSSKPVNKQHRQRKGPFGRLNGGANKKTNSRKKSTTPQKRNAFQKSPKIGVSSKGTGAPQGSRGWQSDYAEPQERKTESKNVVIRYSKKRLISTKKDKLDEV